MLVDDSEAAAFAASGHLRSEFIGRYTHMTSSRSFVDREDNIVRSRLASSWIARRFRARPSAVPGTNCDPPMPHLALLEEPAREPEEVGTRRACARGSGKTLFDPRKSPVAGTRSILDRPSNTAVTDADLPSHWLPPPGDPRSRSAEAIYELIAEQIEARGFPACWASGRCCNFEKPGTCFTPPGSKPLTASPAFGPLALPGRQSSRVCLSGKEPLR